MNNTRVLMNLRPRNRNMNDLHPEEPLACPGFALIRFYYSLWFRARKDKSSANRIIWATLDE